MAKPNAKTSSFLPWLLGIWIVFLVFLFIISVFAQYSQISKNLNQSPQEDEFTIEQGVIFHISHPRKLYLDNASPKGVPFAFWLTYATPDPSTVTNVPPTLQPEPYVIRISTSNNGLGFTNASGEPIAAQVVLTPVILNPTPVILYGALASSNGGAVEIVPILANSANATPLPKITIPTETIQGAQLRNAGTLLSTSAFWGTVLTIIGGLVLAAWNKILDDQKKEKDREEKERDREKAEREKIQNFLESLHKNPEESARLFIEYCKSEQFLPDSLNELKQKWEENAPKEIIMLANLEQARLHSNLSSYVAKLDDVLKRQINPALRYALLRTVDESWKISANQIARKLIDEKFSIDSDLLIALEKRYRHSIVKVWPQMTYWQATETPSSDISEDVKFKYLRKTVSPFGAPRAENDYFVIQSHYGEFIDAVNGDYLYDELTRDYSIIVSGKEDWGKTASAIWLLDQVINRKITALKGTNNPPIFPVYCPLSIDSKISEVAKAFALAIVNYLAFEPSGFFQRSIVGKSSIAHLLSIYIASGTNLILKFREAGLPKTGMGAELESEITSFTQGIDLQVPVQDDDLLKLLSESFPYGFEKTWFLLDFQGNIGLRATVENYLSLVQKIGQAGIITKSFTSYKSGYAPNYANTSVPVRELKWQDEDLKGLIMLRTGLTGMGSISEWCEPDARYPRSPLSPDDRLIKASGGTPRGVIQKANQLLQRIGKKQSPLSVEDLDEIIGPVPVV